MKQRDLIAFGIILAGAYIVMKARQASAAPALPPAQTGSASQVTTPDGVVVNIPQGTDQTLVDLITNGSYTPPPSWVVSSVLPSAGGGGASW